MGNSNIGSVKRYVHEMVRAGKLLIAELIILILLGGSSVAKENLVIGSPYKYNLQQNTYITTGDNPEVMKMSLRFQYQISCSLRLGGSEKIYDEISPRLLEEKTPSNLKGASFAVIYFVSGATQQFIFGTLADGKGRSNGKNVFVKSKDWNCQLFDTQKPGQQ